MRELLAIDEIREDFLNKVTLTDNEKDVLLRYIKKDSIIKIADETKQGTTTVSSVIRDIKNKYEIYKELEIKKLVLFTKEKKW